MKVCLAAIGLLVLADMPNAWSAEDYQCTIERMGNARDTSMSKMYVGEQFVVDRHTGVMTGVLKNSFYTTPQVIDYGSKENGYKVINSMRQDQGAGAGSNIYALVVNEYDESPLKPFTFLRNDEVFFGKCKHL